MRLNKPIATVPVLTHEGGRAERHQSALTELQRAVSTCMLWENTFYEKGSDIADRIIQLCQNVAPEEIAKLAIEARTNLKLRHVPLFLALQIPTGSSLMSETVAEVVRRPDEMAEILAMHWRAGRRPIPNQLTKGLRAAFSKFDEYQLTKWNRDGAVKLRDVMFKVHPKPTTPEQADLYKRIANKQLGQADTWETALSAGKDKKETWERLLREEKLGFMAVLMNLRNMESAQVDFELISSALLRGSKKSVALPFRFLSAYINSHPMFADVLNEAMLNSIDRSKPLTGETLLVIDVSGSMNDRISAKSEMTRIHAASALAILLREVCNPCRVVTFSNQCIEVANVRGLPLYHCIDKSQTHGGTHLAQALQVLKIKIPNPQRIIVITDEQTHDGIIPAWGTQPNGYLCNVAAYQPALQTHGGWTRINGWSERIVDWIQTNETTSKAGDQRDR